MQQLPKLSVHELGRCRQRGCFIMCQQKKGVESVHGTETRASSQSPDALYNSKNNLVIASQSNKHPCQAHGHAQGRESLMPMQSRSSLSSVVLHGVIPVTGILSYEAFAVHICNPSLITRFLTSSTSQTVITCLNYNSSLAAAILLYYRPHIQILPATSRVIYSAFGSIAFNFSSFFLWIMTRDLVKEDWKKSIFALTTASTLLLIAGSYVQHIDSLLSRKSD